MFKIVYVIVIVLLCYPIDTRSFTLHPHKKFRYIANMKFLSVVMRKLYIY